MERLPVELLTQISDHLHLHDLKRFRMVCTATAEAVFERMLGLMPRALTVHGKRSEGLQDLAYLGATFRMGHCIVRLRILYMNEQFSHLLEKVYLPKLKWLGLEKGSLDFGARVVSLLESHKRTLNGFRISDISIVVPTETLKRGESQSWRDIIAYALEMPGLRPCDWEVDQVGYCSPDGSYQKYAACMPFELMRYQPREPEGVIELADIVDFDYEGMERLV